MQHTARRRLGEHHANAVVRHRQGCRVNESTLDTRGGAAADLYRKGHREEDRRANRPSRTGYAPTDGTDRKHLTVPLNEALHGHRAVERHTTTPRTGERKHERLWRPSLLGPTDRRRKHECDRH